MIKNRTEKTRAGSGASAAMTAALLVVGGLTANASGDYGPAIWRPACNGHWYTSGYGHKFHVIHDMEGYYWSVISAFQGCGGSASVHYCVNGLKDNSSDAAPGELTQMVLEANYAWHATCWNKYSTGTEHEGFANNPAWYTEAMYQASAGATAHVASKFGFAADRNHIVGHGEWQNAAWRSYAGPAFGINTTCNTHHDPGTFWDWGHYMALVNPPTAINPPYYFDNDSQGWTAGNGICCGLAWNGAQWPGVIYGDQNGADAFFYSPTTSFTGGANALMNVMVTPQNGTTGLHDMQLFYKTAGENFWDANKSSQTVTYKGSNTWASVNLYVNNPKWAGQIINQLRLDFDNVNHANRWLVNHVVLQSCLRWEFPSDTMLWTAGNGLTAPTWQSAFDVASGIMYMDQTANDAYLFASPNWFTLAGPFHYMGAVNDRIHVRVYPQNGNTASHDMQVFWITDVDGTWTQAKSTLVTYSAQNAWADVYLPVGTNPNWPNAHVTQIRLDFDNTNHGNRWIVDSIVFEH